MRYPLILFVGAAGSGKDTGAAIMARELNGVVLGLADEIKRFALNFGFTDDQLWGPSENRNAADYRFSHANLVSEVENELENEMSRWIQSLPLSYFDAKNTLAPVCRELLSHGESNGFLTPRLVLQKLGTEWGRGLKRDIWIEHALNTVTKLLGGGYAYSQAGGAIFVDKIFGPTLVNCVVIPDGRFRSEIMAVKRQGGLVVRLVDPSGAKKDIGGIEGHVSETEQDGIPDWHFDYTVVNDKNEGLAALEASLGVIVSDITAVVPLGGRSRGNVFDVIKHGK